MHGKLTQLTLTDLPFRFYCFVMWSLYFLFVIWLMLFGIWYLLFAKGSAAWAQLTYHTFLTQRLPCFTDRSAVLANNMRILHLPVIRYDRFQFSFDFFGFIAIG